LLAGYPGTISRWTSDYFAEKLTSFDEFHRVAKKAERNQFSEVKVLLKDLPKPLLLLSIRLALLPLAGYLETWNALKPVILQGLSSIDLDDLRRRDALLEELRRLHAAYREDAAVREQLAIGLFNALVHAKQEEALERRDALLEELRKFYTDYPNDPIWIQTFQTLGNAGAAQA